MYYDKVTGKDDEIKKNLRAYAGSLEHWADWFRHSDEDYASELAYLLEDKAHDIRMYILKKEFSHGQTST